jgi:hypothetical protein
MAKPGKIAFKHQDGTEDVYVASVFMINTRDPNGIPRLCTHIPDDHKVHLAGGEEFMIGYLPESMVSPKDG